MPRDGTRECDAADVALTVLGDGMSSRLYNRLVRRDRTAITAGFGLLRLAGAPSLGWLDVKASGGTAIPQIEAAVDEELARLGARGPDRRGDGAGAGHAGTRWLDQLGTVAGRADELCRYAVLFGDPQLAFTAINRILDITAEEVRAIAAARLRPDNRAVLVYEPVTSEDGRRGGRPGRQASAAEENDDGKEPGGDGRAVTMDFHPQPGLGEPKPWAFPVPERARWQRADRLRCHRPGQQLAAVEICLNMPLDAEPDGLDGIATIMMGRCLRAPASTPPRSSPPSWSAAARPRDTRDYLGARVSLEVPVSRLPKALGLLAEALRAPAFPGGEVERLARNRLDGIPLELANPGRVRPGSCLRSCSRRPRDCPGREGTEDTVARIDAAGVRALYQAHVRPAIATAVIVGDLTDIDLDTLLADTLGGWTGDPAEPVPTPPVTADDTGRVVIVDRPGAVQTQLLIGRIGPDRHDRVWPARCSARTAWAGR